MTSRARTRAIQLAKQLVEGGKIYPPVDYLAEMAAEFLKAVEPGWRTDFENAPHEIPVLIGRDMGAPWGFVRGVGYYAKAGGIEGWVPTAGVSSVPGVLGLGNPTHFALIPEPPQ
jgi:hypothetical protein